MISRLLSCILVLMVALVPAISFGAVGSCTVSTSLGGTITTVTATCTGGTGGDAGAIADTSLGTFRGWVYLAETNPGTTGPTDNYDIVINDTDGVDVMAGALANRSTSASQRVAPGLVGWVDGQLTMVVTNNSAASSTFVVKIYIYREP